MILKESVMEKETVGHLASPLGLFVLSIPSSIGKVDLDRGFFFS
jgi:hypothetical protein